MRPARRRTELGPILAALWRLVAAQNGCRPPENGAGRQCRHDRRPIQMSGCLSASLCIALYLFSGLVQENSQLVCWTNRDTHTHKLQEN